jgi:NAD(P)-dependent dehydrogenase (short-subunit alcohol dehydrogenase family)
MADTALENPTSKFSKPPFKRQTQPWPGLAGQMEPRPDHGEKSYKGSGRLAGRKALITGGGSHRLCTRSGRLAINYFPGEEPDAQEVIGLIKAEGRIGLAIRGDLRDEKFCQELVARARESLGGLDIIVNNAARQQSRESILDVSSDDFDATNVYAPFWIIKAALPYLKPGAVIIGTSSEQAYDPSPELYDYAQTKAATMNYVKSLAKQLGPKGIRVNAVAPGPIWTPLQVSGGASMEKLEKFGGHTPLGRPGQPLNWRLSTCSWQPATQVMQTVRSTARLAAPASPKSFFGSGSINPAAGSSNGRPEPGGPRCRAPARRSRLPAGRHNPRLAPRARSRRAPCTPHNRRPPPYDRQRPTPYLSASLPANAAASPPRRYRRAPRAQNTCPRGAADKVSP